MHIFPSLILGERLLPNMNVYQINCSFWSIYHVQVPTFVWPTTRHQCVIQMYVNITYSSRFWQYHIHIYPKIVNYQTLMLWKSAQARRNLFSESSKSSAQWIILHLSSHMFGNLLVWKFICLEIFPKSEKSPWKLLLPLQEKPWELQLKRADQQPPSHSPLLLAWSGHQPGILEGLEFEI